MEAVLLVAVVVAVMLMVETVLVVVVVAVMVAVLIAVELLHEGLSNWFWLESVFLKKLGKMNKYFYFQKIPETEPVELEPFPWWLVKDILKANFFIPKSRLPPFGPKNAQTFSTRPKQKLE